MVCSHPDPSCRPRLPARKEQAQLVHQRLAIAANHTPGAWTPMCRSTCACCAISCTYMPGGTSQAPLVSQGMAWLMQWGSARLTAAAAFMFTLYADAPANVKNNQQRAALYCWAQVTCNKQQQLPIANPMMAVCPCCVCATLLKPHVDTTGPNQAAPGGRRPFIRRWLWHQPPQTAAPPRRLLPQHACLMWAGAIQLRRTQPTDPLRSPGGGAATGRLLSGHS